MERGEPNLLYIPLDITQTILSKLPIKDVLRFKVVCKSWNAMILNLGFGRIHLNNSRHDPDDAENQLFAWPSRVAGIYHLSRCFNGGSKFQVVSRVQCPIEYPHPSSPLCSCDGFFLMTDEAMRTCVMWNPVTQSSISFAYPAELMNNSPYRTTQGICYDAFEDDYKVVFVDARLMLYTVFSCKRNSWTETKRFPYAEVHCLIGGGVSVGGVLYWAVSYTDIVYFDAKDCGFKKLLHKPPSNEVDSAWLTRLTNLNGRLCLYRRSSNTSRVEIWVLLQQERWVKQQDNVLRVRSVMPWSWIIPKTLLLTEDGSIHIHYISGLSKVPMPVFLLLEDDATLGRKPLEVIAVRATLAVLPK